MNHVNVWEAADDRPRVSAPAIVMAMVGAVTGALVGAALSHAYLSEAWVLPGSVAGVLAGAWGIPILRALFGASGDPAHG